MIHEDMKRFFDGYPSTAHPMAILSAMVLLAVELLPGGARRQEQGRASTSPSRACSSKVRTIAAFSYKKSIGQPFVYPQNSLSLLRQLPQHDVLGPGRAVRDRRGRGARCSNLLLILHADHEQNCSHLDGAPGRQLAGEPVRLDLRRHLRALGPAPRRRQPGGPRDARDDPGRRRRRAEVRRPRQGQGLGLPPDGLRPPRLQELRSAREDHQGRRPTRSWRS